MVLVNFHEMWKPVLVMIIVNLALAFVNVFLKKVLSEGMDHLTILTYRQAISAIFLAPIACFFERESKINGHIICLLFFSALVGATLTQYLYLVGLEYTSATFSCAFLNTVPIFTFIMALPMGMEKVDIKNKSGKAKILGTFVCIGGALVLILYKGMAIINPQSHQDKATTISAAAPNLKKWIIGSIFLTAGCLLWSSWFLIQERVGKKYPYQYSSTAILSLFATIQSAILNLIVHRNNAKWILKGKLQILTVVYSMFVAVLDLWILKEEIYLGSVVGSVLVISGMYMLLWGKSKDRGQCALKDTQENQKDEECH
ncbi:WAT1-related protein [Trifolium repens]|nr:WAT1-related protein [Trifolium repens]